MKKYKKHCDRTFDIVAERKAVLQLLEEDGACNILASYMWHCGPTFIPDIVKILKKDIFTRVPAEKTGFYRVKRIRSYILRYLMNNASDDQQQKFLGEKTFSKFLGNELTDRKPANHFNQLADLEAELEYAIKKQTEMLEKIAETNSKINRYTKQAKKDATYKDKLKKAKTYCKTCEALEKHMKTDIPARVTEIERLKKLENGR